MTKTRQCPGCLITLLYQENLDHYQEAGIARYGVTSPECTAAFFEILSKEAQLYGYPPVHRLIVDAYAVQHPPHLEHQLLLKINNRFIDASIQSVNVHLIALYCAIERKIELTAISSVMNLILTNMTKNNAAFEQLEAPLDLGKIRAFDVRNALLEKSLTLEEYTKLGWEWAHAAWNTWSKEHDAIRKCYDKYS
jgi:hypothetical protein